jgi:hypothetical protein
MSAFASTPYSDLARSMVAFFADLAFVSVDYW